MNLEVMITYPTLLDDIAYILSTGELRDQVEGARVITEGQEVVLDKIECVHRFFQELEVLCNAVKEVKFSTLVDSLQC